MNEPKIHRNVHEAIDREFARAYRKHHGQTARATDDATALVVLVEEVGEVARAMTYDEGSEQALLDELVQVANVAAAWADRLMNGVEWVEASEIAPQAHWGAPHRYKDDGSCCEPPVSRADLCAGCGDALRPVGLGWGLLPSITTCSTVDCFGNLLQGRARTPGWLDG